MLMYQLLQWTFIGLHAPNFSYVLLQAGQSQSSGNPCGLMLVREHARYRRQERCSAAAADVVGDFVREVLVWSSKQVPWR